MVRYYDKQIESAFQSKLTFDSKHGDKRPSTHTHYRDKFFRGGRHGRGGRRKGWGRSVKGRAYATLIKKNDENSSKWCNICKKNNHNERDCWNKGKP